MCVCVCWYFMYRYVFPSLRYASLYSLPCAMFRPFYFPTRFHLQGLYSFALSHSFSPMRSDGKSFVACCLSIFQFNESKKKKKRERFFYCFLLARSLVCWCWCVRSSRVDFLSIATAVFYATVKPINDFFFLPRGKLHSILGMVWTREKRC